MKLVIDIPDEMHKQIMDGYVPLGIGKYLKNGKPYTNHNAKAFKECKRFKNKYIKLSKAIEDIKAEIIEKSYRYFIDAVNDYSDEEVLDLSDALEIIDKHIGERSEDEDISRF